MTITLHELLQALATHFKVVGITHIYGTMETTEAVITLVAGTNDGIVNIRLEKK